VPQSKHTIRLSGTAIKSDTVNTTNEQQNKTSRVPPVRMYKHRVYWRWSMCRKGMTDVNKQSIVVLCLHSLLQWYWITISPFLRHCCHKEVRSMSRAVSGYPGPTSRSIGGLTKLGMSCSLLNLQQCFRRPVIILTHHQAMSEKLLWLISIILWLTAPSSRMIHRWLF
jgi:hypothetical protein